MRYETVVGDYGDALADLLSGGGQFFPSNHPEGASTILRGQVCVTYWPKNSRLHAQVLQGARMYNCTHESPTAGRLARFVLSEICGLDTKDTYYGKFYSQLAKKGEHWHYTHVEPGYHPFLIEFDLKSAYFTSLFHGQSLLFHENKGWLNDNGALDCLREITPSMPKWLRLTILGILASHKSQFYTRGKDDEDNAVLQLKTVHKIKYGSAFNAAHRAVHRTYKLMQRIHEIGGEHIKRMHTDSFAITPDIPQEKEDTIFALLSKHGYTTTVKASGSSHFINLNEGLIGKKVIGGWNAVREHFREHEIKIPRYNLTPEEFDRWKDRMLSPLEDVEDVVEGDYTTQLSLL